jgi:hypothetical protein
MILTAKHPSLAYEKAYLSQSVAAGATKTYLKSVAGFATGKYVVLGLPGSEKTEIVLISSVNSSENSISHLALKFSHSVDAPVAMIKYNQVRFYKSDTIDGTYTLIQTVDIDIDDTDTEYDYPDGVATEYYRVAYYNQNDDAESIKSDPLLGSGYSPQSVAKMIEGVRVLVGEQPSDEEIISMLNLAEAAIYDYRDKWYFAKERKVYNIVADQARYPLPNDFKMSSREVYHIKDANTVNPLLRRDYNAYMKDYYLAAPSDDLGIYTIDEGSEEVIFNPTPKTNAGTVEFGYWAGPSTLLTYTDCTKVPSTRFHVFFAASKIEVSKKNETQGKLYWNESQDALRSLGNKRYSGNQSFGVA